jgi:hypothetical protein
VQLLDHQPVQFTHLLDAGSRDHLGSLSLVPTAEGASSATSSGRSWWAYVHSPCHVAQWECADSCSVNLVVASNVKANGGRGPCALHKTLVAEDCDLEHGATAGPHATLKTDRRRARDWRRRSSLGGV